MWNKKRKEKKGFGKLRKMSFRWEFRRVWTNRSCEKEFELLTIEAEQYINDANKLDGRASMIKAGEIIDRANWILNECSKFPDLQNKAIQERYIVRHIAQNQ